MDIQVGICCLWAEKTELGICSGIPSSVFVMRLGKKLENTAFGVALYYAGGDVNAKVIRRNPSVRDDNVHLGLLVGAGLALQCGSYLLRLRVGCTHLGGLAYNAEVVTYLLPEWF